MVLVITMIPDTHLIHEKYHVVLKSQIRSQLKIFYQQSFQFTKYNVTKPVILRYNKIRFSIIRNFLPVVLSLS